MHNHKAIDPLQIGGLISYIALHLTLLENELTNYINKAGKCHIDTTLINYLFVTSASFKNNLGGHQRIIYKEKISSVLARSRLKMSTRQGGTGDGFPVPSLPCPHFIPYLAKFSI